MPQASDELRGIMQEWFGSLDLYDPQVFLQSHGFDLTARWTWNLPVPHHSISCYELACVLFLVEEWDYGGIENDVSGATVCLCGEIKSVPRMFGYDFGKRREPCGDCDERGHCTMNCSSPRTAL